jgi:glutamine amidotransferase-like uncharacterized protein
MKMKCPFLKETIVRYCSACPKRKMIPNGSSYKKGLCEGDYYNCPMFMEFLKHKKMKIKKEKKVKHAVKSIKGKK